MFCPECGSKVNDTAKFCPSCGADLKQWTRGDDDISAPATIAMEVPPPNSIATGAATAVTSVPPSRAPVQRSAWPILGVVALLLIACVWAVQAGIVTSLGLPALSSVVPSLGKPGATEAQAVFRNQLVKQLQGSGAGAVPFEIVSFDKTNGQARSAGGVEAYTLEYVATIVFPQGVRSECVSRNGAFTGWDCYAFMAQPGVKPKSPGERQEFKGEISFEKTEKGWKGPDGNVY